MPCWHITTSPFLDDEFNLTIGQRFQAHVLEHTVFTTVVFYKSNRMGGRIRRPDRVLVPAGLSVAVDDSVDSELGVGLTGWFPGVCTSVVGEVLSR